MRKTGATETLRFRLSPEAQQFLNGEFPELPRTRRPRAATDADIGITWGLLGAATASGALVPALTGFEEGVSPALAAASFRFAAAALACARGEVAVTETVAPLMVEDVDGGPAAAPVGAAQVTVHTRTNAGSAALTVRRARATRRELAQ